MLCTVMLQQCCPQKQCLQSWVDLHSLQVEKLVLACAVSWCQARDSQKSCLSVLQISLRRAFLPSGCVLSRHLRLGGASLATRCFPVQLQPNIKTTRTASGVTLVSF